jgi:hypothetical protein
MPSLLRAVALLPVCLLMFGCAALGSRDPLQVTVAGIEPLQGQGLEMRMNVKLRIQNPNDTPLTYNGVALQLDVQGRTFATGVSDASGSVPRFGETVISVPVTISAFRMVRQAMGVMTDGPANRIAYEMRGKLNGTGFGTRRFTSKGELNMPMPADTPDRAAR